MLRFTLALAVAVALTGCADNFDEDLKAVQDAPFLSTGGTAGIGAQVSGTGAQVRPESVPKCPERAPRSGRNRCPSQAGIGAQVRPENARKLSNGYFYEINLSANLIFRVCNQALEHVGARDQWRVETRS